MRTIRSGATILWACLLVAGCVTKFIDPTPKPVLPPTPMAANFDRAWDAAVGWFAERNIPIQTIEKASGIIVADVNIRYLPNRVDVLDKNGKRQSWKQSAPVYADCGGPSSGWQFDPTSMIYNIRVKGDGAASSVQVNARYVTEGNANHAHFAACSSTGKWEDEIQAYIKQKAEAGR